MLSWLLYLIADAVTRLLPRGAADRLGRGIARLVFGLHVPARAQLESNLRRLLGPGHEAEVVPTARAAFENFALSLTDFLRLGRGDYRHLEGLIEVQGAEHLAAARSSGRGVILLSAHLGSWELGAAWLAGTGAPVHMVARPHPSRLVERFYARRRGACGVGRITTRPLWVGAAAVLRRGEWVALMVDRGASDRAGAGRASAGRWAASLARRTGALVLPGVIVRLPDRRFSARFGRPCEATEVGGDGPLHVLHEQVHEHANQWAAFDPLPEGLS